MIFQNFDISFLGGIPIDINIRLGGDQGIPVMAKKTKYKINEHFLKIAKNLVKEIDRLDKKK